MATANINYATVGTASFSGSPALADGAWFASGIIDNSSNLYIDAHVAGQVQVKDVSADGSVDIYVAASFDGTDFTAGVDQAGEGGVTWGTTGNTHVNGEFDLPLLASVSVDTTDDNQDVFFGPFSVAQAFGGVMPQAWRIVIENNTGSELHTAGASNKIEYTGITYTSA